MRISGEQCAGYCYQHGTWAVQVERLSGENAPDLFDACPQCHVDKIYQKLASEMADHISALNEHATELERMAGKLVERADKIEDYPENFGV